MKTEIEKAKLEFVLPAASKNDVRDRMNCIYFDKVHNRIVASNGHILAVARHDLKSLDRSILVDAKTVRAAIKSNKSDQYIELDSKARMLGGVSFADRTIGYYSIDGQLPQNVEQTGEAAGFDFEYLTIAQKAFKKVVGGKFCHFAQNGEDNPAYITQEGLPDLLYIIMPVGGLIGLAEDNIFLESK
jgi:DNA polymerase III sliding clamp (beta) subunit (PCNA family)